MWYDSLQVTHQLRRRGVNILTTYTLSKHIEQESYLDVQKNVLQRSLYFTDTPHRLTVATVYELPVGKGRKLLNVTHPFWSRLLSGWQTTQLFTLQSGRPASLPGGVRYLRDARIKDVDWSAHQVRGIRPCVARLNEDGTITPQSFSLAYGCGADISTYNFLILPPYAPRETPFRSNNIRIHGLINMDMSLSKTTAINERLRVQFRAEAFNAFNTNSMYRQQFNTNVNSAAFGTIIRSTVTAWNANFPRHIQLAVKLLW
jgi:hypothetical protein